MPTIHNCSLPLQRLTSSPTSPVLNYVLQPYTLGSATTVWLLMAISQRPLSLALGNDFARIHLPPVSTSLVPLFQSLTTLKPSALPWTATSR